jgi:ribose/xylose/arabinose/galactoside ABC-type transport system permease subunit
MFAFVISGLCAAIGSVLYTGRLETGTPVLGQRILLDVVGAAVIGGVSLFGGKGRVTWTLSGVLFLTVVDKGLQLLGLDLASVFAIKGGVILTAAVLDALRHRLMLRG